MIPVQAAWAFLPFVAAIGLYVAWSDMKSMRIPNIACLALAAVYLIVGPMVLPLADWGWGWLIGLVVLVIGFGLNAGGLVGGGDAKFAAAMAPFFVKSAWMPVLGLFAACVLAAFVLHRILRAIPAVRRATPGWTSWDHIKFPMGMALSATIVIHLVLVICAGSAAAAP
ncbi:MAG: prepilin peptidase [Paracoccaceae bacterium]